MNIQVSIDQAYAEACQALGEEIVKSRIFSKEVDRLNAQKQEELPFAEVDPVDSGMREGPLDDRIQEHGKHTKNGKVSESTP